MSDQIIKVTIGKDIYIGSYEKINIDTIRMSIFIQNDIKFKHQKTKFDIDLSVANDIEYIDYDDFYKNYFGEFL